MSTIPLSDIQQIIERSIFEQIRKELVDKGYLPDITAYPDSEVGYTNYQAAIASIVSTKGYAIELFNEGSNMAKGIKKVPRIVINTGNFLPGALGGDPQKSYVDKGLYYQSVVTPPQTVDFYLSIHLVSNTVAQERVLNSLLALAIQRRGYVPFYSDASETFFCRYLNFSNADDLDEGIMEKVYAYEIPDCWDSEDREIDDFVAKMTRIELHPNILKYIDGEWGSTPATDIIVESDLWNPEIKDYAILDILDEGNHYRIMDSLAQNPLNNDKVIMTFLEGSVSGAGYDATKTLQIRISNDKGQTFGTQSTAYIAPANYCVQEQHSGYTNDGRLHILVTCINVTNDCLLKYLYSDDDGVSFVESDISALVADVTYDVYRNSGDMVENNGVLLAGLYNANDPATPTSSQRYCLRLVDGNWTKVLIETTANYENEISIEVLEGDNLIALVRQGEYGNRGFIQYLSIDNGLTWSRLGAVTLGITSGSSMPGQLKSFYMNGEKIIVMYTGKSWTNNGFNLWACYGKASDLLVNGITGWNTDTTKYIKRPDINYSYIYHGSCLHYNHNYNSIGCWSVIESDYTNAAVVTFEADTNDYNGLLLALFPELMQTYSGDTDANKFINYANITSSIQQSIITDLIVGLKTDGIWSKIKALFPAVGSLRKNHIYNLKNSNPSQEAFMLHFFGTWLHSAMGMKPNGIDGYADTCFNPAADLTLYSAGLGYYSRTNISETGVDMGCYSHATNYPGLALRVGYTDGKGRMYAYNCFTTADAAIGDADADTRRFVFGCRSANNVNKIYYDGVQSGPTVTVIALNNTCTLSMFLGANNENGIPASFGSKECALAIITDLLNDTEAANLNSRITTFQTALGRNI